MVMETDIQLLALLEIARDCLQDGKLHCRVKVIEQQ
jgi:hypothetical protein